MNTGEITVKLNEDAVRQIALTFGDDIFNKRRCWNFFNLALVTLLAMGEEIKKGKVIVSMNRNAAGGFSGKMFNFPKPVLHQVK